MAAQAVDTRLRKSPPYIGWVPGVVNLLRSAPKVPGSTGGVAVGGSSSSGNSSSGSSSNNGRQLAGSGDNWAAISGQV